MRGGEVRASESTKVQLWQLLLIIIIISTNFKTDADPTNCCDA